MGFWVRSLYSLHLFSQINARLPFLFGAVLFWARQRGRISSEGHSPLNDREVVSAPAGGWRSLGVRVCWSSSAGETAFNQHSDQEPGCQPIRLALMGHVNINCLVEKLDLLSKRSSPDLYTVCVSVILYLWSNLGLGLGTCLRFVPFIF